MITATASRRWSRFALEVGVCVTFVAGFALAQAPASPESLIPGLGDALGAVLSQEDCERANRNGMIVSGVVALLCAILGFLLLKLLESRHMMSHGTRLGSGLVLATGAGFGVDFYFARSAEQLHICLNAAELCKYITLCGSHQALRSVLFTAVPAGVLLVVGDVVRSKWGHRN